MKLRTLLYCLLCSIGILLSPVNRADAANSNPAETMPLRYQLMLDEEARYYHILPNSMEQWQQLGTDFLELYTLTEEYFIELAQNVTKALQQNNLWQLLLGGVLLLLWWFVAYGITWLAQHTRDHELFTSEIHNTFIGRLLDHLARLWLRSVWLILFFGTIVMALVYLQIPNIFLLLSLMLVLLAGKLIIDISRIILLENLSDHAGRDVKFYHAIEGGVILGGLLLALTLLAHQLPVAVYLMGFIDRLFLVVILIVSISLLKNWRTVPLLIQPYVQRRYLQRAISVLSALIPLVLMSTAIIGLLGYVVLAWRIGVIEAKFMLVLIAWIVVRGVANDIMSWLADIFIRKLPNGWLWSEAVLKPLRRVINVLIFLLVVVALFWVYGFERGAALFQQLRALFQYTLFSISGTHITLGKSVIFVTILMIVLWAAKWSREFAYRWLFSGTKDYGLRNTFAVFTQYIAVFIGGMVILKVLGIDLTTLAVVLGALSLGIGIGLQNLANSLVSGLILLIERPLQVGDLVKIADYEGEVTRVGMRSVTVNTWDHKEVIIPNADTISQPVTNWTHRDNIVRITMPVRIGFDQDPHQVQKIIAEAVIHHKDVLKDPKPEIFFKDFMEFFMLFDVRIHVDLRIRFNISVAEVRSEVLFVIWDALRAHNIPIPYPQQNVNLIGKDIECHPERSEGSPST